MIGFRNSPSFGARIRAWQILVIAAAASTVSASVSVNRFPNGIVQSVELSLPVVSAGPRDGDWYDIVVSGEAEGRLIEFTLSLNTARESVVKTSAREHRCPVFLHSGRGDGAGLVSLLSEFFKAASSDGPFKEYVGTTGFPASKWCRAGGAMVAVDPRIAGTLDWTLQIDYAPSKKTISVRFTAR